MTRGGRKAPGRDYSRELSEMLPEIIGAGRHAKTIRDIAKLSQRDRGTVDRLLSRMRKATPKQAYIHAWKRGAVGPFSPMWKLGDRPDEPAPAAYSSAEKSKRYRQTERGHAISRAATDRWRASEDGKEHALLYGPTYRSSRRARIAFETGGVAAVDPLLAAIMGKAA